ncbi:hypothetical protein AHiyo1_40290 [Arthrobacter sp. Hiyo1]|nr:hypothetical protein AHiyo1_40290 [Arthrobacter sp. Hiyo1]
MQGNRQDPGVVPEDALGAVAVVGVDVDVRDPPDTAVEQPLHGESGVVIDTEAAGPLSGGMVKAAAEVDGPDRGPGQDCLGREQGPSGEPGAGSCIPANAGSSSVPSPRSGSGVVGSSLERRTAATYSALCTARSSTSDATSGAWTDTCSRSKSPSAAASLAVSSSRAGAIGCEGPKLYAVMAGSHATVVGSGDGRRPAQEVINDRLPERRNAPAPLQRAISGLLLRKAESIDQKRTALP